MDKITEMEHRSCVDCGLQSCEKGSDLPGFCPGKAQSPEVLEKVRKLYEEEENRRVSVISAQIEDEFYLRYTRVEEVVEFARRMGFQKLGIATCVGLIAEARTAARIFRAHGFEVFGVACKCGVTPKSSIGIPERCEAVGVNMCNPVLQAKRLNEEKTGLNILIGLCVGHDSLFYRYSEAPVTTLVAKDRVLAHNPAGALYQADKYYDRLLNPESSQET